MRYFLLIAFVIFCISKIYGQDASATTNFQKVDAHVKTISQRLIYNPQVLAKELTDPFDHEHEQARAIYTWIATNIEYNLIGFKNGLRDTQNVNEVLVSGKALCNGFSLLFVHLCKISGLQAEIIAGYAKGYGYEEGQKFKEPNHAWNAIYIDRTWYLCDVTWASGISNDFVRGNRNIDLNTYFMADPESLIATHLPEDPSWQLLDKKQTLEGFEKGMDVKGDDTRINGYAPDDYQGMTEYDKDVLQFKRSLQFNQDNVYFIERLSFAYIYKGISLTDELWALSFQDLILKSEPIKTTFLAYMDSAWQLIDPLPLIRIQKSRRIIEDEINYQKGVFHYEMGAELFNKGYNRKESLRKISVLTNAYFTDARRHFENVSPSSIYTRDARDYLNIIDKYESRLRNP